MVELGPLQQVVAEGEHQEDAAEKHDGPNRPTVTIWASGISTSRRACPPMCTMTPAQIVLPARSYKKA